jgi:hypothetical protein
MLAEVQSVQIVSAVGVATFRVRAVAVTTIHVHAVGTPFRNVLNSVEG